MFKKFVIKKIQNYRTRGGGESIFSVDCNFTPSCSEYALQAFEQYGFLKASLLSLKRISRCTQKDLIEKIYDPLQKGCTLSEIMLDNARTQAQEEKISRAVASLDAAKRKEYYEKLSSRLLDPDTYAVTALFFFGIHHFYAKKLFAGTVLFVFSVFTFLSFFFLGFAGFLFFLLLLSYQLFHLFYSQWIVKKLNNRISVKILQSMGEGL